MLGTASAIACLLPRPPLCARIGFGFEKIRCSWVPFPKSCIETLEEGCLRILRYHQAPIAIPHHLNVQIRVADSGHYLANTRISVAGICSDHPVHDITDVVWTIFALGGQRRPVPRRRHSAPSQSVSQLLKSLRPNQHFVRYQTEAILIGPLFAIRMHSCHPIFKRQIENIIANGTATHHHARILFLNSCSDLNSTSHLGEIYNCQL